MPTPLRRRMRLARRGLVYGVAVVLVLVAVLLGAVSQVLPLVERHPERVAAWLSGKAGRPVAFDGMRTAWTRRGPLLELENLRIGEPGEALEVGDAEMLVSVYAGLLPGQALSELRLRGLSLRLERDAQGRWHVRGLPGQQRSAEEVFGMLESLGELQVIDGRLRLLAPGLGIDAEVPRIQLRLQVDHDTVRAAVRAWPQDSAKPVNATLSLERRGGGGRAYVGADEVDLAEWSPLLRAFGVAVASGHGRAEAWARLSGSRIVEVTARCDLAAVSLVEVAGHAGTPVTIDQADALVRWQLVEGGWRFDAPRLALDTGGARHSFDGLQVAGGRRHGLAAERIDLAPLVPVLALSPRVPVPLREWLRSARPRMTLRDVELAGEVGGAMRFAADVEGFGFEVVGDAPALSGLGGHLRGDASGFAFVPDDHAPVLFDWPSGFGVEHRVRLQGTLAGWRGPTGWELATPGLRVDGGSFGTDLRGGLAWQGDGSRPRIDVAARIDTARVTVAKGFWVRHRMPAPAVEWLDNALVDGTVRDGRAVLSGDLDDWPFLAQDGLFEARARIEEGVVAFQPGWPALEGFEADVRFAGDGFSATGSGELEGLRVARVEAGIDHYQGGRLAVDADARGDAGALLDVLRASPLRTHAGDTLDHLSARGDARVDFGLRLPLVAGQPMQLGGRVDLAGAVLGDSRWNLRFEHVSGRGRFDRNGFQTDGLSVVHEGQPGTLSLRAGEGHVQDAGHAFEGRLEATLDARDLLARAPDLAWLAPHVNGRSPWRIGVDVPQGQGAGSGVRLTLDSALVGTAFELPEPMRKPAGEALPVQVDTSLPWGTGDVSVGFGDRLALRARSTGGRSGVRVVLGAGRVDEAPPAQGLRVSGHAERLDAIDWIAFSRGGGDGALSLAGVDVTAGQLHLLGGRFPDTRLQVSTGGDGQWNVVATGDALNGRLAVPRGERALISGHFERVYWMPQPKGAVPPAGSAVGSDATPAAAGGTTPGVVAGQTFDPAAVPPLDFEVDALRIKQADLGRASFRSRPEGDGMRIETLTTEAPLHAIDVDGLWRGQGQYARTRMSASVRSADFGALFEGLGLGGRTEGGEGTLRLDASWPGSPADFSAKALEGRLAVDAQDGALLEVEPGAGRVLGLLSVAQLPRRLMLDFGDLFSKGFAYNRVDGGIVFAAGRAHSDALRIDGPAADIDLRGSADLRAETFDQTIEVRPKAGNLLTAVGAIAGGPVGAAIGAAANAVLEKPLGDITAKTYHVTGPWKSPHVEVVTREVRRASDAPVPSG